MTKKMKQDSKPKNIPSILKPKPKNTSDICPASTPETQETNPALPDDRVEAVRDKIKRSLLAPKFKMDGNGQVNSDHKDPLEAFISLSEATGTGNRHLAGVIAHQLGRLPNGQADVIQTAALGFMHENAPKDSIEGMLLATMFKANYLAAEFANRALKQNDMDLIERNVNRFGKLSRLFTEQLDALQKYRGKGQQKVTVEHVTVNEGGQAVIAPVIQQGGGGNDK